MKLARNGRATLKKEAHRSVTLGLDLRLIPADDSANDNKNEADDEINQSGSA